jgi:predicted 3-demethylubiquinone-9 3-methyltransferase (glyoxalase superfamily)
MVVDFELDGQRFTALNGGPHFKFNEAISLVVHCQNQEEVDYYWEKLTADGGQESQCGWLKDKFGLSWQITPDELLKVWSEPDPAKAQRVMQAMMTMKKLIIKDLEAAAAG